MPPDRYDSERQSKLEISELQLVIVICFFNALIYIFHNRLRSYNAIFSYLSSFGFSWFFTSFH